MERHRGTLREIDEEVVGKREVERERGIKG